MMYGLPPSGSGLKKQGPDSDPSSGLSMFSYIYDKVGNLVNGEINQQSTVYTYNIDNWLSYIAKPDGKNIYFEYT